MKELVFSVKDLFNNETADGCLSQYEADLYHIPAYQRGYKWSSDKDGAVTLLLQDLWQAFIDNKDEYYLQYITVKPVTVTIGDTQKNCLEVIDGQQRLTTLSVLLSAFASHEEDGKNIADEKLHYAIRANLFGEHIYLKPAFIKFAETKWEDLLNIDGDKFDRQDVWYLHSAVVKCFKFLNEKNKQLTDFSYFVLDKVKVIVNSIEPHIESETVFKNLNSNKVALTETELIKALLITNSGRNQVDQSESHFREVMEVRAGLGRKWDEIQYWCNSSAIKSFFFKNSTDPMHELLKLSASLLCSVTDSQLEYSGKEGRWLFALYARIEADVAVRHIIQTREKLADWFDNNDVYHLIGFCRFSKSSGNNSLKFLRECLQRNTHSSLMDKLLHEKNRLLFGRDVASKLQRERLEDLSYGNDSNQMQAILLALSVFPPVGVSWRFDFEDFVNNHWSLEHIFPQTPEGKKNELDQDDKENIRELLKDSQIENSVILEQYLNKEKRSEEEKQYISDQIKQCKALHGIGNMCLLTGGDNSALGCSFFNAKRKKILEFVQHGSFVPKHTFDVFSKMITNVDDNLRRWSLDDMKAHTEYIVDLLCEKEKGNESR